MTREDKIDKIYEIALDLREKIGRMEGNLFSIENTLNGTINDKGIIARVESLEKKIIKAKYWVLGFTGIGAGGILTTILRFFGII